MIQIVSILLKIFSSKKTYIILFILTLILSSVYFVATIKSYKNKMEILQRDIKELSITNELLLKENIFNKDKLRLLIAYSNSSIAIDNLKDIELSKENKDAINFISNDFYNFFISLSNK